MQLNPNQVFVFGTNSDGFHGAGGAGLACRGESANTWRDDQWFLQAMRSSIGSPGRIGKWAIFGVSLGFQQGREGMSYGIQTVTKPGHKRSISLDEIASQIQELWDFVGLHPEWEFLISPLGEGYAGYSAYEMSEIWDRVKASVNHPNVIFLPKNS